MTWRPIRQFDDPLEPAFPVKSWRLEVVGQSARTGGRCLSDVYWEVVDSPIDVKSLQDRDFEHQYREQMVGERC